MTQPDITTLARKWKLRVNTGSVAVPAWTLVYGMSEFTFQPFEANIEDDDDYEKDGYKGRTKTGLGWSAEAKINRKKNPTSGIYDPGQQKLRERASVLGDSKCQVQMFDRDGGDEAFEGWCEVEWVVDGGSTTDLETVTVTLHGDGPLEEIANPDA